MSLLPASASTLERRLAETLADAQALTVPANLWDPWSCPAVALPALAWALRVDEWDDAWPEPVRRQVCADAIEIHRRRGTRASIQRALRAVGLVNDAFGWTAEIVEGVAALRYDGTASYDGVRDHGSDVNWAAYTVTLNRPVTVEQAASARRLLDATAPARCELYEFNYEATAYTYRGQYTHDGSITHGAV